MQNSTVHILIDGRFKFQISRSSFFFFFNDTATTEIYTLSLHDALPISTSKAGYNRKCARTTSRRRPSSSPTRSKLRSEEHTSELQSPCNLVCRLLLEKKKKNDYERRRMLAFRSRIRGNIIIHVALHCRG